MNKEKTIIATLSVILTLILALTVYWLATNIDVVKSTLNGAKLYTQKEVAEAYDKGVADKVAYEKEIKEWVSKYDNLLNKKNELQTQITIKEKEIEKAISEKNRLQDDLNSATVDKVELENQIKVKDLEITNLTKTKNELARNKKELESQIQANEMEINNLLKTNEELQVELDSNVSNFKFNQTLIDAINNQGNYIVAYKDVSNYKYKYFLVKKNEAIGNRLPILDSNYHGWVVDSSSRDKILTNESIAKLVPNANLVLMALEKSENGTPILPIE